MVVALRRPHGVSWQMVETRLLLAPSVLLDDRPSVLVELGTCLVIGAPLVVVLVAPGVPISVHWVRVRVHGLVRLLLAVVLPSGVTLAICILAVVLFLFLLLRVVVVLILALTVVLKILVLVCLVVLVVAVLVVIVLLVVLAVVLSLVTLVPVLGLALVVACFEVLRLSRVRLLSHFGLLVNGTLLLGG